jgi:hypothetical protein
VRYLEMEAECGCGYCLALVLLNRAVQFDSLRQQDHGRCHFSSESEKI